MAVLIIGMVCLLIRNRRYSNQINSQIGRFTTLFNDINVAILELNITSFEKEVRAKGVSVGGNIKSLIFFNAVNKYCLDLLDSNCESGDAIELLSWIDDTELERVGKALAIAIMEQGEFYIETTIHLKGEMMNILLTCPNFSGGIDFSNVPFHFIDITERTQKEIELMKKSQRDALTQLLNREYFISKVEDMIAKCAPSHSVHVLFVDLDKFKPVNDTYGHHAGDILLQSVAQRMAGQVRKTDYVCRIGGDEFCIAIDTNGDTQNDSSVVAMKIIDVLSKPFKLETNMVGVGCSVGISRFKIDSNTVTGLIQKADDAMYKSKKRGGGCYTYSGD